jgi:predicted Zn-dependent protease with MMP-like domain
VEALPARRVRSPAAVPRGYARTVPRNRRRDRRGRGPRGPLCPPQVPLDRSRSERFDHLVLAAVERLEQRWAEQLRGVEFAIEEVPPADPPPWATDPVPLGRVLPVHDSDPARIVLYRRPLETRAQGRDLGALVHDVVVEHVAQLLGLGPDEVDPHWEEPGP